MRRLIVLLALLVFSPFVCRAEACPTGQIVQSTNALVGGGCIAQTVSPVLSGTYLVATLPAASVNQAKYAFVTDLGGGADMVISDGTNWKHIRQGTMTTVAAATTITQTPLSSPPIIMLSGSNILTSMTISVASSNLYVGYLMHVIVPSTLLGVTGSLGVSAASSNSLPLVGGYWYDIQYTAPNVFTTLAKGNYS